MAKAERRKDNEQHMNDSLKVDQPALEELSSRRHNAFGRSSINIEKAAAGVVGTLSSGAC